MSHRLAVYLVLERDGAILYMMRAGTGYRDGEYGLPSGKVEHGELLAEAMAREAYEEIGLQVEPGDLVLRHVVERRTPWADWIDCYFTCDSWPGEPVNAEPHKCDHLRWIDGRDDKIVDYVATTLSTMRDGIAFSTHVGV